MDEIGASEKLKRFCYLGAIEQPIYVPTTFDLTVDVDFAVLRELCNKIKEIELVDCLSSILAQTNAEFLPRRDEALLVLAIYLSTCSDEKERTKVRGSFELLVRDDTDLFMFMKYVKQVQKCMDRKTPFSRTVRKAVLKWYGEQPLDKLLHMWSVNAAGWAMHRDLLHRCHYTDIKYETQTMAAIRVLSTPLKELLKWPEYLVPLAKCKETIVGISELRLMENVEKGLPIIKQLSLNYEHIPRSALKDTELMNYLLPKMTYEQLLDIWPKFLNLHQRNKDIINKFTKLFFEEKNLRAANVEPIRFLLQEQRHVKRQKHAVSTKMSTYTPSFMHQLYKNSFGFNKALGLRLHITLNLEMCYLTKSLTGRWRSIKYIDAVVAVAFGYYMCDPKVIVQHWHDKSGRLRNMPWTRYMSVDEAKICCGNQKVIKIKQTFTDILDAAHRDTKNTFDVFLVIVPCGTRGNSKNSSENLCLRLNEYRQNRNINAKFIIMSLRQHHKSMSYSKVHNEHILELCSISEQTPRLISAFAHGKFI